MKKCLLLTVLGLLFLTCKKDKSSPTSDINSGKIKRTLCYVGLSHPTLIVLAEYDYKSNSTTITRRPEPSFKIKDSLRPVQYTFYKYQNDKILYEYSYLNDNGFPGKNEGIYNLAQEVDYLYDGNKLLFKDVYLEPSDQITQHTVFGYFGDNLISESVYDDVFGSPINETLYEYNANLKVKTIYKQKGAIATTTKHRYDNSLLAEDSIFNGRDSLFRRYTYLYDGEKRLTDKFEIYGGQKYPLEHTKYNNGKISEFTEYLPVNRIYKVTSYEYY